MPAQTIALYPFYDSLVKYLKTYVYKTNLIDFINKNELLFQHHFDFQKGKSREHAIFDFFSDIIKGIENREKTACIFLDFAKAFDTVNHEILLRKLHHYGVRGIALELFQSFSLNCKL